MTGPGPYLEPRPGLFMAEEHARRTQCLADALALTHGRSVPIHLVWALARWIYNGEAP